MAPPILTLMYCWPLKMSQRDALSPENMWNFLTKLRSVEELLRELAILTAQMKMQMTQMILHMNILLKCFELILKGKS